MAQAVSACLRCWKRPLQVYNHGDSTKEGQDGCKENCPQVVEVGGEKTAANCSTVCTGEYHLSSRHVADGGIFSPLRECIAVTATRGYQGEPEIAEQGWKQASEETLTETMGGTEDSLEDVVGDDMRLGTGKDECQYPRRGDLYVTILGRSAQATGVDGDGEADVAISGGEFGDLGECGRRVAFGSISDEQRAYNSRRLAVHNAGRAGDNAEQQYVAVSSSQGGAVHLCQNGATHSCQHGAAHPNQDSAVYSCQYGGARSCQGGATHSIGYNGGESDTAHGCKQTTADAQTQTVVRVEELVWRTVRNDPLLWDHMARRYPAVYEYAKVAWF